MPITDQVTTAPSTDCVQAGLRTFEAMPRVTMRYVRAVEDTKRLAVEAIKLTCCPPAAAILNCKAGVLRENFPFYVSAPGEL